MNTPSNFNHINKKRIALFFGGKSSEHEISILSAVQLAQAIDTRLFEIIPVYIDLKGLWYMGASLLDKSFYKDLSNLKTLTRVTLLPDPTIKGLLTIQADGTIDIHQKHPIDCAIFAFHGQHGEDGCMQGLFELAAIPYTGSNVASSAIAMNKYLCKKYLESHGVPTLPSILVRKEEFLREKEKIIQQALTQFGNQTKLFVKPNSRGSSIGASIASGRKELIEKVLKALQFDEEALIEPCITDMTEINVSVIGGRPPKASVIEVPIKESGFLSYEDKYLKGGQKFSSQGMASLSRLIDPQDISKELKQKVIQIALEAYRLIGAQGVVRFDFIYDKKSHKLFFNELNAIPGSFSYYLWEKSTPPVFYPDLIESMVKQAEKRHADRSSLKTEFGFHALK